MNSKKIFRKILVVAFCAASALSSFAASPSTSVRDVDYKLDPSKIVEPLGLEADYHKLMNDWYANRYLIMDKDVDKITSKELSDQDYIDRLQKIQTDTTMEMTFNPIVRSFIKMYVERRKGLVEAMLGRSLYYNDIFEEALLRNGVPLELRNLAIIESALTPTAVSKAGAAGLWQFMPSTAKGMGLEITSLVDERYDPYKSSDAAAKLLKQLYNTYGDWSLAIAAYNCGPGNVNKALKRAGGGQKNFWEIYRYLPSETRDYLPAFIAANYAMTYYKDHGISPVLAKEPIITDTIWVNRRINFKQISDVLGIPMEAIRALNPQYRKDVIPGNVKPYALVLPNVQVLSYIAYEDSISNYDAKKYARKVTASPISGKTKDPNGEGYIDEVAIMYHKVGKDDDIVTIATKYGIDQEEVIRANGGSPDLQRGTNLQLNVVNRTYMAGSTARPRDNQNNPKVDTNTPQVPANDVAMTDASASESSNNTGNASNNIVPPGAKKPQPVRPTPPPPAKKPETAQQTVPQSKPAATPDPAPAQVAPKQQSTAATQPANNKKTSQARTAQAIQAAQAAQANQSAQAAQVSGKMKNQQAKNDNKAIAANSKNNKKNVDPEKPKGKKGKETANAKDNGKKAKEPAKPKTVVHETKEGQNLTKIAKQHGISVEELKKANNLKSDKLSIGQKLTIPAKKQGKK